jgi:D-glycero-alpha-D-manno-heptose-7-phosphate kinase
VIIVQTPLRVSFFGGGTDFRPYFLSEGGCVLSAAIDKYIFVTIKRRFDQMLRVGYTRTEMVESLDDIQHELIRESLRRTGICSGVEVTTMGDIPSQGSGLGSSSTVTVGALHAMHSYLGNLVSAEQLAVEACEIEIDTLGKPVGIQDQYIAAFGSLRFMEFMPSGEVICQKLELHPRTKTLLEANTMLFFTGITRESASILTEQKANISSRKNQLGQMKQLAHAARDSLIAGDVDAIGALLHESWQLKKQLASQVSNSVVDQMYSAAREAGAIGGKISGAGAGGFLLLYCPYGRQEAVRSALAGLQELPFKIEPDGTKVIFNYQR